MLAELEVRFAEEADDILGSPDVARALQERTVPSLRHHYEQFIEDVPGEEVEGNPSAYVLAAGYANEVPFIVKVDPTALVAHYEGVGFHAMGSGAPMAQRAAALLGHFQRLERDVDYGVLVVVRVLEALRVSQPTVGGPLGVVRITPDEARRLEDEEIDEVRKPFGWREEAGLRALDSLFDGDP